MQTATSKLVFARLFFYPRPQCISKRTVLAPAARSVFSIYLLDAGIEKVSGRVAYAVMSFGGFLGLAHSHYPIPWSALKYDTALGGYRTGITEGQLKDAPAFSDDSWTDRDWETRTHQHYRTPTYWGA